jgi:hypothetical protein
MSGPQEARRLAETPFMHRGIHPLPQRRGAMERLSAWAFPTSLEPTWQLVVGGVSFVAIIVAVLFSPLVLP